MMWLYVWFYHLTSKYIIFIRMRHIYCRFLCPPTCKGTCRIFHFYWVFVNNFKHLTASKQISFLLLPFMRLEFDVFFLPLKIVYFFLLYDNWIKFRRQCPNIEMNHFHIFNEITMDIFYVAIKEIVPHSFCTMLQKLTWGRSFFWPYITFGKVFWKPFNCVCMK